MRSINGLIGTSCERTKIAPDDIAKATVSGNSTMMHLLLGIPAESIRLEPFITPINHVPQLTAADAGIAMHPAGSVDPLPGVASYVGADITAGVLASELRSSDDLTLFIDVGTNGEIVLGSLRVAGDLCLLRGPAFEGAGVVNGMRADTGAIEEVWIDDKTYEPSCRVIGNVAPRGICGSGLISLVAEMFLTGLLDKGGNINETLTTPRVRQGLHGAEYVVAWAAESEGEEDIVIARVGHRQPVASQSRDLRGIRRTRRQCRGSPRDGRAGVDWWFIRQVHQRGKGRRYRLSSRHAVGAFPLSGQHVGEGCLLGL